MFSLASSSLTDKIQYFDVQNTANDCGFHPNCTYFIKLNH